MWSDRIVYVGCYDGVLLRLVGWSLAANGSEKRLCLYYVCPSLQLCDNRIGMVVAYYRVRGHFLDWHVRTICTQPNSELRLHGT